MWFLNWSHFSKDNEKLKEHLQISEGRKVDLKVVDGFFICPEDKVNSRSSLSHLNVDGLSIIDMFKENFPEDYGHVEKFFRAVGGFDRLNYTKLKIGAKLGYFYAVSFYVFDKGMTDIKKKTQLYQNPIQSSVMGNLDKYLAGFVELAAKRGVQISILGLFDFAKSLLISLNPNFKFTPEFSRMNEFIKTSGNYPYGLVLGDEFEKTIQDLFEKRESKHKEFLTKFVHSKVGKPGVLLAFDANKDLTKAAEKAAAEHDYKGLKIPDYIYITDEEIIHLDLKVNLSVADPKQVSKENLRTLFLFLQKEIAVIFCDIKVEGKFIETPKAKKEDEKVEKKAMTPMQAFPELVEGYDKRSNGTIAKLWGQNRQITEDHLISAGITKGNLAQMVKIFNEMLKDKK
jgi:hypothetical protein